MKPLEYDVRFTTPAFLGNAEQNGQWRTPPFKALLRHWWRVAWAADHGFRANLNDMRREEGLLFGNAWLSHREHGREVTDHRKSLVRLRLGRWDVGRETKDCWGKQELDKTKEGVKHPEVGLIGPKLYLGYGPLVVEKVVGKGHKPEYATILKKNAAIQADESTSLSIAFPATHSDADLKQLLEANAPRIEWALWLMDRYGTLGGRSRNGWGSLSLEPLNEESRKALAAHSVPLHRFMDCVNSDLDWPHAIGQDDQGALIWQTKASDGGWEALMRELAIIKIGLRTQFVFPNVAPPHRGIEERHWLSYPITKHVTNAWPRGARLPNQLRFKVRPTSEGKLVGVIFHVPHLPPREFAPVPAAIERTWQKVHSLLDELRKPASVRTYLMIADASRRAALRTQLDTVGLIDKRITE